MTETKAQPPHISKFQLLLRELFQFDCADLDFGIYRIMNYKRDAIEEFITETLPRTVADELDRGPLAQQVRAVQELEELAQDVRETLGEYIDAQGNLDGAYHGTTVGRKYLNAKEKVLSVASKSRESAEIDIFNHLNTFFSRYYQDGDFISKRRYSKRQRYAIPYNGEEVFLHWANSDQYYIKTAEHFHEYTWKAPNDVIVHFKLLAANVEQNNVKGEKRFFLPRAVDTAWDPGPAEILIPFEYRPLTQQEKRDYSNQKQQDKIIADAVTEIPHRLGKAKRAHSALTRERGRNGKGEAISYLKYHLHQYTRRNTSDFFIHKDLKGFLTRELDFYLKNEVLNLDEMENAGQEMAEGWFQMLRLIKSVGSRIIDFLAQIESFQKMLWEKRKFITESQYCITMGSINERFYPDIAGCEGQWSEWKAIIDITDDEFDVTYGGKNRNERRIDLLRANATLVVDTMHFEPEFVDRLLGSIDDLDGMTDGVLVYGENFQALGLLLEQYRNKIECIYVDPPYNTGDSEILYKNEYLSSSWLSLMENRLTLAMQLLKDDPVIFIAIDDFEMADLCELIDKHFPILRREMIVVNHHPQGGKAKTLANTHEYMLSCVSKTSDRTLVGRMSEDGVEFRPFKRSGTAESNFRHGRPNSFYAILVDQDSKEIVGVETPPARGYTDYPTGRTKDGYVRVYPMGAQGEERVWRRSYESCVPLVQNGKLQCRCSMTIYQRIEANERTAALFSNWIGPRYNAGTVGATLLGNIIGKHNPFSYPKSVYTVEDALFAAGVEDDAYCVDFFAGSGTTGHAVINLNREDGGQRKFILVEMGNHFDTVLLPRIKKVTFSPEWKNGKPKRKATPEEAERSPRVVKCIRLESYEDVLNNIEFDDQAGQAAMRFGLNDYFLKYMLKWETKHSETLLNVEKLVSPFSYQLNIHIDGQTRTRTADVPETFNYLLGLNVRTRRVYDDGGRRYLVYKGETRENPSQIVAVIWRDTSGWSKADFERDKQFVAENKLAEGADLIYVNGDSFIPNARALEPLFKSRMFAGVQS